LKQSIAKDALVLTGSKIITLIISMITVMLLSHFLTLEEYGTYSQILLVVNLVTTFILFGLPSSINYFLGRAENEIDKRDFLSTYFTLSLVVSFISGLILVLCVNYISNYFSNPLIKNFLFVLAVYPWSKIFLSCIDYICICYKKVTSLMVFRITNSFSLLIIIFIVEEYNLSFSIYMFLYIIVQSIFTIIIFLLVKSIAGNIKLFRLDLILVKKILKFAGPVGLATAVGVISIELDKLVIGWFFTTEELAIYTNASRELPITVISSSMVAVVMPKLVSLLKNNKKNEAISLWGSTTSISYIIICFFATIFWVFAEDIIVLLYSDKFLPGSDVFRVYTLVLLLRVTYFGIILNSIGKTKFIFYSSIASLIMNMLLNYPFYLVFGFLGPAIATVCSIFLVQIIQLIITSYVTGIKFKYIFPWKNVLFITTVNISFGLIFYYINSHLDNEKYIEEFLNFIMLSVVWGGLYFGLMFNRMKKLWITLKG